MSLTVRIDDRFRLVGALLAAGDWPEYEQSQKPYKPHRVAEAAHRHFAPHAIRSAVKALRNLAGHGEGLPRMFTHALNENWPGDFAERAQRFIQAADPQAFYDAYAADWAQAEADARQVLERVELRQFLIDLIGPAAEQRALVFVPNLLYPGRDPVAVSSPSEVVVTAPPPLAWGTSPPWRYSERPDEALAIISEAFARFLLEDALPLEWRTRTEELGLAAAVLFLRQAEGPDAGDQLMVMQKRTRGLNQLPATVAALEAILADRRAGRYPAGVAEYAAQLEIE